MLRMHRSKPIIVNPISRTSPSSILWLVIMCWWAQTWTTGPVDSPCTQNHHPHRYTCWSKPLKIRSTSSPSRGDSHVHPWQLREASNWRLISKRFAGSSSRRKVSPGARRQGLWGREECPLAWLGRHLGRGSTCSGGTQSRRSRGWYLLGCSGHSAGGT